MKEIRFDGQIFESREPTTIRRIPQASGRCLKKQFHRDDWGARRPRMASAEISKNGEPTAAEFIATEAH